MELEELLQRDVDLIWLNRANSSLAWEAIRGDRLFVRNMDLFTEFMSEVSREAEDFERFVEDLWLLRRKRREEKDELPVKDRSQYDREGLVKDSSPGLQSIIRRPEFARAELSDMEQYRSLTYSTYNDDGKDGANEDQAKKAHSLVP